MEDSNSTYSQQLQRVQWHNTVIMISCQQHGCWILTIITKALLPRSLHVMKGRISSKCPPVVQHIKYAKKNVKNNLLEQMQE